jgi:hypothetical protein
MIQLAYPLGLLALVAIPIVLALHLLQPRRLRVVVSTTTLWQAALREREHAHGFRRLLRNLSLALLLAAAAALALALSGPQWPASAAAAGDAVLVLDVSASMKTRSGPGTTRFHQALAEAARLVDALPHDGRMLVMTSGRRAVLRTGFESDRDALRHALAGLRAGDEAGAPREALALALSLLRGRSEGRVYFLTDGAFDPDVDPGSPQVELRVVGGPARNVAITRFDFRQAVSGEDRFEVLMTVRNYTDAPAIAPASATLDGRLLFRRSLELAPRGEQTLVLAFPGRALGQAVARIDVEDGLAADNQAFAAVNPPDPLRVLLLGPGNFYLESVLQALPGVELFKSPSAPAADIARLALGHDVVVIDGIAAPRLPPGNYLLVNTVAPGLPFADTGRAARPGRLSRGRSALMRDVDLAAVRIDEARSVATEAPSKGLQRLFWSAETDLALALLDDELKLVYLGFDLARSNFPLQAAFPMFISQSLEWLRRRGDGLLSTHVAAGAIRAIDVPAGESRVTVRPPSGAARTLETKDGTAHFEDTAEAGIYRYAIGDTERTFAVSLADAAESDVNSRWRPRERQVEARPAGRGGQALVPLWPWLLALALGLLALEWCVWAGARRYA